MGSRTCARVLLERTLRAASCFAFNNVGALCLIAPLAASLMLRFLSPLQQLYTSEYLHTVKQPFLLTPACIFLICILILVAITITSHPHKDCRVPAHVLHLPFNPVQATTFTSAPCNDVQARPAVQVASRLMARSSSHSCLARHADQMQQAIGSSMQRSPSHSAFLTDGKPFRSAQRNAQDEAPAVFTLRVARSNSQPFLAGQADEMQQARSPRQRSPSPSAFLFGAKPLRSAQSNDQGTASAVLTRRVARSSSQPCLARLADEMQKANNTMRRSPSHNTFLTGAKPMHVVATENLSDEEPNRRFSAFIESRLAAMKREMVE